VTACRHGHRVLFATATDWVTRLSDEGTVEALTDALAGNWWLGSDRRLRVGAGQRGGGCRGPDDARGGFRRGGGHHRCNSSALQEEHRGYVVYDVTEEHQARNELQPLSARPGGLDIAVNSAVIVGLVAAHCRVPQRHPPL